MIYVKYQHDLNYVRTFYVDQYKRFSLFAAAAVFDDTIVMFCPSTSCSIELRSTTAINNVGWIFNNGQIEHSLPNADCSAAISLSLTFPPKSYRIASPLNEQISS
jgi:hypothetical protein